MRRVLIAAIVVSLVLVARGAWALPPAVELARLQHDGLHLTKINAKPDAINRGWSDPPEPEKAAFRAALDEIIAQGNMAVSVAQRIENKVQ